MSGEDLQAELERLTVEWIRVCVIIQQIERELMAREHQPRRRVRVSRGCGERKAAG